MSRFQEFSVTRQAPLNTAATRNHQKFCAHIHSSAGTDQLRQSKITVHTRRPSLSVRGPLSSAHTIWLAKNTVDTSPISVAESPRAAMYTETKGR